jgi:hypothetical protein
MIGSYRAIRLTGRIKDKRLWIFHITYFVTLALQLVLGWLALYNQKFQWCFWLSFIAPIILAIQMFFGWFVDRVGFFMLLPALVLQILMIYVYYKFWKLNA